MGEVVAPGMEKWTRRCGEKGRTETEEVGEEGGGCAGVGGRRRAEEVSIGPRAEAISGGSNAGGGDRRARDEKRAGAGGDGGNEPTGDASDRRGWGKWRWPEATSRRGRRRRTWEAPAGEVRGGGWEEWII